MSERLRRYRDKRHPERTSEPMGDEAPEGLERPVFVVQHHAASSEHYDLRLEHDGVLLSWAVPKGPSTDPREKRLAVRVEDHPLGYADFEGAIPEEEYGGGSVIVWDLGTWTNTTTGDDGEPVDVADALDDGHLNFRVDAEKLGGGYTLQRFRPEEDQWLLVKRDDDDADARRNPTSTEPESVRSGHTVAEIADLMDETGDTSDDGDADDGDADDGDAAEGTGS